MIGGSAGSIDVLLTMLPALKPDFNGVVILVLHRKRYDDAVLASLFTEKAKLPVKEAEEKERLQPGTVYLAPADYHLLLEKDHSFSLDYSEKVHYCRPSIDVSFESAADVFGNRMAAILLSGANADGVEGLKQVKNAGGFTIVQSPDFALVDYMPKQALQHAPVDKIMYEHETVHLLNALLHG
ncbi:MAG: chemotaxis protein CheB [Chitinophagaceae bacterium]